MNVELLEALIFIGVMVLVIGFGFDITWTQNKALARIVDDKAAKILAPIAALLVDAVERTEQQQVILAKLEQIDSLLRRRPHGTAPFDNGYSPAAVHQFPDLGPVTDPGLYERREHDPT